MKRRFNAAALFTLGALVFVGCGGSDGNSPANPGSNDTPIVEKPTVEKIAGTWERTYSETMTDSGTDVGTRTTKTVFNFNSDGTFTQVDKIVKDYTEADGRTDTTAYNAFKGTVSANDTAVTCVLTGKVINSPTEIIDFSAVTWDTYNVIKTFPAIIIEGTLYAEDIVFQRTGTGTGLLGEWTCETRKGSTAEGASYGGEKMIYTFTDSGITGKMQSKDSADGDWADDMSYSGTYTLTDETHLGISVSGMTMSFAILATGDYFIMGTDKGYTRK